MSTSARRRLGGGVLLLALIAVGLVNTHRKEVSELVVYVLGAERMSEGLEIYRPDDAKPFTYPPSMALPFLPFLALPERAHRTIWFFVNALTLGVIVGLMRDLWRRFRAARPGTNTSPVWIWGVTLALAGRHVAAVFENQSHDMLVFLAVTLTAWCGARGREACSGAAAGLGAALKATPLLFLPVFVLQRRVRAALSLVVATALLVWLPDLVFPRVDGASWVGAWYRTFLSGIEAGGTAEAEGAWSAWNFLNQNLAGSLYRLTTPVARGDWHAALWDVSVLDMGPSARRIVTIGAQLAVLGSLAWCVRPALSRGEDAADRSLRLLGEAGLVGCGMVLLSPMSSKAHFCVLTLAIFFAVIHYADVRRDRIQLAGLVLCFVSGTLTAKGVVGSSLGNELLARGSVMWHTLIVMAVTERALCMGASKTQEELQ